MGRLAQRQIFSPSCPSGGTWYACSTDSPSQFVGCCAGSGDPCKSSCSSRNLRPASFDPTYYVYLPDVSCPSTSSSYKCPFLQTPFFGCCKSDPCSSGGCASSDLDAASLPSDSSLAAAFSPSSTYSSSTPTSTSSSSSSSSHSSTTSATTSASASTTPTPAAASSSSKHTKLVAGGAGGGAALFAIIVGWLLYHCLYARKSRKLKHEEFDRRQSGLPQIDTAVSQIPKQDSLESNSRTSPCYIF